MINTRYKIKFFAYSTIFNAPRFVIFVAGPVTIKAAANTTLCAIINFDITPGRYPFIKQKITANISDSCILWHFLKNVQCQCIILASIFFILFLIHSKGGVSIFELYELRQLITFAETGTLSEAAEILHLSQPALSRNMKKLEEDLGLTLFERTKNKLSLNKNGEVKP